MGRKNPHRAELDKLQAELVRPAPGRPGGPDKPAAGDASPDGAAHSENHLHDLAILLHEFQDKLAEAAEDAEDLVIAHPLAAVGMAFLVGLVIGRVVSRS